MQTLKKALLKFIQENYLPYQFVEYRQLCDLVELCNPATSSL